MVRSVSSTSDEVCPQFSVILVVWLSCVDALLRVGRYVLGVLCAVSIVTYVYGWLEHFIAWTVLSW